MVSTIQPLHGPPTRSHRSSARTDRGGASVLSGITAEDVAIKDLGKCLLPSPVTDHLGDTAMHFVGKADRVLVDDTVSHLEANPRTLAELPAFELAGPRDKIFFDPRTVRCGIVTFHAVVAVAEGAAQELVDEPTPSGLGTDRSGNTKLKDIGVFLRDRLTLHFKAAGRPVNLKYIDPSYTIRSIPASPSDSIYCWNMARNAVHAAMAANTEMLIGQWHGRIVHIPMPLATRLRKQVEPADDLWMSVIEATGQPRSFS